MVLDKIKVRYDSDQDKYWAELVNFGHRYVHIPERYIQKYDRLLMGGLGRDSPQPCDEEARGKKSPFWIEDIDKSKPPPSTWAMPGAQDVQH